MNWLLIAFSLLQIISPIVCINTVQTNSIFQQNSDDSNEPVISKIISYKTIKDNDELCFILTFGTTQFFIFSFQFFEWGIDFPLAETEPKKTM